MQLRNQVGQERTHSSSWCDPEGWEGQSLLKQPEEDMGHRWGLHI